jgi:hypothetical protein
VGYDEELEFELFELRFKSTAPDSNIAFLDVATTADYTRYVTLGDMLQAGHFDVFNSVSRELLEKWSAEKAGLRLKLIKLSRDRLKARGINVVP